MKIINKNIAIIWSSANHGILDNSTFKRKVERLAYLLIHSLNLFLWCFHYYFATGGAD
jgi:hypothetical protein